MKKRALALLLALLLALELFPAALAAEEDVRQTDFFTDQVHGDVDFADMTYEHIDCAPLLAEMDAVQALLDDPDNREEAETRFQAVTDSYLLLAQEQVLLQIRTAQDVTDSEAMDELTYTTGALNDAGDRLCLLVQAVLKSECDFLSDSMSLADILYYRSYAAMSDEEKAVSLRISELTGQYSALAAETWSCEYGGRLWTEEEALLAYYAGELGYDGYLAVLTGCAREMNQRAGAIYLELTELRQTLAREAGYDSYDEYAYAEVYGRDYGPEDIRDFESAVREVMPAVYDRLETLYGASDSEALYRDYSGDAALDMMEPYIARMSSEMLEAFDYMREHGLYDSGRSLTKDGTGFTAVIPGVNEPFFFNTPSGGFFDFTTAVHEFGHYNSFYWSANGWNDAGKSMDVCEVHSQGLELLFSRWYGEEGLFGEDAQAALDYQTGSMVGSMLQGCMVDELERFVYTFEGDLTVDDINAECARLGKAYGLVEGGGAAEEYFSYIWTSIPHCFSAPCYYVSYAVSAAGAFAFWLEAQEDYFSALDRYLAFTALDAGPGFEESFEAVGLESPLSAAYVRSLSEALDGALELTERAGSAAAGFSDVPEDAWYAPYVTALAVLGLMDAGEDGLFRPEDPATRSDAAAIAAFLGGEAETGDGDAPLTRLDACRLLAEALGLESAGQEQPFTDTDDAAVTALAELGAIDGCGDGTFRPEELLTRAQLCAIASRLALAEAEAA